MGKQQVWKSLKKRRDQVGRLVDSPLPTCCMLFDYYCCYFFFSFFFSFSTSYFHRLSEKDSSGGRPRHDWFVQFKYSLPFICVVGSGAAVHDQQFDERREFRHPFSSPRERERGRLPWKTNSSDYWLDDQMKNFSTSENIWKWLLNYLTIRRINQLFTSHNICLLQFISVVQTFAYQPVHIVSPERRFRISVSSSRPPGRKSASSSSTSSTRKILRKPKPGISLGYVLTCMIKTIDTHPTRRGSGTASSSESLWPGKHNRIKIKASVSRFSSCGFGFNGVENMRSSRNFRHIINYNVISLHTTYRLLLVLLAQMELTFSAPADALSFLSSFFSINSIVKIIHGRNASQRRMHPAGGRGVLKGVEWKKEKNRQGETEFDPVYFLRGVRLPFVALLGMRLFSSLVC